MNTIKLKKLSIKCFNGIYNYTNNHINQDLQTFVAKNGSGKSSISQAINWLLGFNVQDFYPTLNNAEIHDLTPCVEAEIDINNLLYTYKKEWITKYVLNEELQKMVKKSATSKYSIDGMEFSERNFKDRLVADWSLPSYEVLERILNKEFFNTDTTKWKWNDRRKFLLEICGVGNVNETIINNNNKYDAIKDLILKGNATSDIQSMLSRQKRAIKEQQDQKSTLITQKNTELAELLEIKFDSLLQDKQKAQAELEKLQALGKKEVMSEEVKQIEIELLKVSRTLGEEFTKSMNEKQALENEQKQVIFDKNQIATDGKFHKQELEANNIRLKELNKPIEETCPTCKQSLPKEDVAKVKESATKLINELETRNAELTKLMNELRPKYEELDKKNRELNIKIANFKISEKANKLQDQKESLELVLKTAKQKDLSKLSTERISSLQDTIDSLTMQLGQQNNIDKYKNQIKVWQNEKKELADNLVQCELQTKLLKEFVKEQCDLIENKVNNYFGNNITFALFEWKTNNGEPQVSETCETMFNNKLYSNLSTGEKLICNLRICEKIQEYYNCNAFLFCDNAESITAKIESDRQLICLYAQKDKSINGLVKIEEMF